MLLTNMQNIFCQEAYFIYFCADQLILCFYNMEMNKSHSLPKEEYLTPEALVVLLNIEGVICSSNEMLDEKDGEW